MTIGTDLARQFDPAELAVDCGIIPDDWQRDLLRQQPRRALLLCSRQSGKSTVAGLMGLHRALFSSAALVLIVSPSQRQSGEMFRSVMGFYHKLNGVPEISAESVLRCEFKNGSRIVALPGQESTIRGYSGANLIILDEASRVADELIGALSPMLATSNGSLVALTTPAGKRGWFYESWVGSEEWTRVRVSADDCARISKEFLAEELRRMGPSVFSEEYGLQFVDAADSMWTNATIEMMFEDFPAWND